ncbi:hypothetical protein cce_0647 [Crocosphaera subtropica ATCC 51142]|uniref:Uncharacterized protein n=1 Tax=Crocosphaera subtropica (strain ATCC 51142 / BH68) TaxID=43989 RepID=B1WQ76_CROS5|nr:hypothetical protein cce_0647 [Crocosphaera subtropica ATCC 51142]
MKVHPLKPAQDTQINSSGKMLKSCQDNLAMAYETEILFSLVATEAGETALNCSHIWGSFF